MSDTGPAQGGLMVVISGPSGSGKTTICRELCARHHYAYSISETTRAPRGGEASGAEYVFVDDETFIARAEAGYYLEWAQVYDCYYGTPLGPIEEAIASGRVILLNIDPQGALILRDRGIQALYLFLLPPSLEVLRKRLVERQTDSPAAIQKRLDRAQGEMDTRHRYDVSIINGQLEETLAAIHRTIEERRRHG